MTEVLRFISYTDDGVAVTATDPRDLIKAHGKLPVEDVIFWAHKKSEALERITATLEQQEGGFWYEIVGGEILSRGYVTSDRELLEKAFELACKDRAKISGSAELFGIHYMAQAKIALEERAIHESVF